MPACRPGSAESAPPALVASRVLADLAALWFEQPSTPRAIVLPIADTVDGAAARQVLAGLHSPTMFRTVALDSAFTAAAPLRAGDGTPAASQPAPGPSPTSLPSSVATEITALRAQRDSVQAMVGPTSPILAKVDGFLLRSMALGLTGPQQRAEIAGGRAAVQGLADAIQTPDRVTITLTARDGKVPLTIRNDTGGRSWPRCTSAAPSSSSRAGARSRSPSPDRPRGSTSPSGPGRRARSRSRWRSPRPTGASRWPRRPTPCAPRRCPGSGSSSRWAPACSSWSGGRGTGGRPGAAPSSSRRRTPPCPVVRPGTK